MLPAQPTDSEPSATFASILDPQDPLLRVFLDACENNDAQLALQLASDRDCGLLTIGLNRAVEAGHQELAKQLLHSGAAWDARTVYSASHSLDAVKLLVEFGFKVNNPLENGGVILPVVIHHNDEPIIRYLLLQGADPNLGPPLKAPVGQLRPIPNSGLSLNTAAQTSTPEIFALLLSHGAVISNAVPLHRAAGVGRTSSSGSRIPMMEYLIGLGIDINAMDDAARRGKSGQGQRGTPLHYAVIRRRLEVAQWLLEHGADPCKKSVWGRTVRDLVNDWQPSPTKTEMLSLFDRY